jgi:histidinol-phosphate aminotransferase
MSLVRRSVDQMHGYVPGEQPSATARVIKLNTNENPYAPSGAVRDVLAGTDPFVLRRYPDPMCRAVRARIAQLHGCAVDQVFAGNGSDEVLTLMLRAFVEDDGWIGHFDPSYSLYPVLAQIRGVPSRAVALTESFRWPEPLPAAAAECPLFFITNPNAPTGLRYPAPDVAAFCDASRGVVVVDEAYVDFADGDCMALALERPNALVVRTLSKGYSLAGVRFGYAVGPVELIGALQKVKDAYNVNALTQAIALAALNDQDTMRANAAGVRRTRARLSAALAERGFAVTPSETNFLWARPPSVGAAALFAALKERHVYIRHFPGPHTGDHVRITIGTDEETDVLLAAVDGILSTQP